MEKKIEIPVGQTIAPGQTLEIDLTGALLQLCFGGRCPSCGAELKTLHCDNCGGQIQVQEVR
jgi:predicted amidophosphoribosyltransferase